MKKVVALSIGLDLPERGVFAAAVFEQMGQQFGRLVQRPARLGVGPLRKSFSPSTLIEIKGRYLNFGAH